MPDPMMLTAPEEGWPEALVFDGRWHVLWWGQDRDGKDCVAAVDGRILIFDSAEDCSRYIVGAGKPDPGDDPGSITDLSSAQQWLGRRRSDLDLAAALNLLNWSIDLGFSVGDGWDVRRRGVQGRVYDKLFFNNVPWVMGRTEYEPKWTVRERSELRLLLARASHEIRLVVGRGIRVVD